MGSGRIWTVAHGHAIKVLHKLGPVAAVVEGEEATEMFHVGSKAIPRIGCD